MDLFDIVAARQGGTGGGAPQKQADWNQNDSSKKDYIKNRTHWKEEVERDYTVLPNIEPDPTIGFIEYGKKIGLEIGKEYTLEAHLVDGTVETIQAIATEFPVDEIGIAGIPWIYIEDVVTIVDGVVFDLISGTIVIGDNCYYVYESGIAEVLEKGIIKNLPNVERIVHKIPKEYLPQEVKVDQVFNPKSENAQSGISVKQAIDNIVINTNNLQNRCVTGDKIAYNTIKGNHIADKSLSISKIYNPTRLSCTLPDDISSSFIYFSFTNAPFLSSLKSVIHGEIGLDDTVDKEFHIMINGVEKQTIIVPTDGLSKLNIWVSLDCMDIPFFDNTYSYVVLDICCGDIREKMIIPSARYNFSISFCTVSPGTNKLVSVMTNDTKIEHTILHQ